MAKQHQTNDGISSKDSIGTIQDINPSINLRLSASRQLLRNILPQNARAGLLKYSMQKVQATTGNHTSRNVIQKYRWNKIVDKVFTMMRSKNVGLCKKSGKTFGEVVYNFIIGMDEMCIMSDTHGDIKMIISEDK